MRSINKYRVGIYILILSLSLCAQACGEREATRRFLVTLDDAAVISGQARKFVEVLFDQGKLQPQTALGLLRLVDRLDAANREVLLESRNYLVVDPSSGEKVLRFNETGKADLSRQVQSFAAVAQALINDQGFLDLRAEDRKTWSAISGSLAALVLRSASLVGRIKAI